MKENISATIKI